MRRSALTLALALALAGAASAQDAPKLAPSPILTLDPDRMFAGSLFGKRVTSEIEAATRELAAENSRIEAELTAEERKLTEQRPDMAPADFQDLADAFDKKVERIRDEQDAKSRDLGRKRDEERKRFLAAAAPVLGGLAAELGAFAIIDRQAIVLSLDRIDATDAAIARLDEVLGDGTQAPEPPAHSPEPSAPAPDGN